MYVYACVCACVCPNLILPLRLGVFFGHHAHTRLDEEEFVAVRPLGDDALAWAHGGHSQGYYQAYNGVAMRWPEHGSFRGKKLIRRGVITVLLRGHY